MNLTAKRAARLRARADEMRRRVDARRAEVEEAPRRDLEEAMAHRFGGGTRLDRTHGRLS